MQNNTLKKNDELEVVINRLGSNGEGIAIHNGIVIFVMGALPGEKVLVHIINDKNKFLIAKLLEVRESSSDRVIPPCPYFSKCGGCDVQHMCYSAQLKMKKDLVFGTIKKYAGIETDVQEVVSSPKEFRYRNKFAFPVIEEDGEIKIGMFKKNSHKVVEIHDCLLQSDKTKIILKIFKEYLKENKISAYNEQTKKGTVKHIVVRESGESFILSVVVTDEKFNNFDPLIQKLQKYFSSFGLYKNVNKLKNNVIFGNLDLHIFGIKELEKEEFGVKYFVNNRSFLQVNDDIKNLVYQKIIELVGENENVIDAYSGAGLLSSILAKNSEKVYGVEIVKEATENANNLKKINNLHNLTNINGDCAEEIESLIEKIEGDFAVVVDPPRKGLDANVVDAFLKSEPEKIVYLSCDPATLARDIKLLSEKYELTLVEPYDMFPQTANVETLVCLKLKTKTQNKHKKLK